MKMPYRTCFENDAEDILTESDHYEIVCETAQYDSLADALDKLSGRFIRISILT